MSDPQITEIILKKLDSLELKLDALTMKGCAKVITHEQVLSNQGDILKRLSIVEQAQAEGRGKLAIAMLVAGAALAALFQWIGRHVG